MSNSKLVNYVRYSPNYNKRTEKISKITIHHMAGKLTVEECGAIFASKAREASSNYGIGSSGRVGLYVDECNRSWCSSNEENDQMAITIEVANDEIGGNWHVSDKALSKLIDLCVDICERNNIEKLNFTGDKNGNLTLHKYFASTACPGPYLESKMTYITQEVNKRLGGHSEPSKSISEIAKEVIAGKWGNGDDRKNRLAAAGYDYATVQAKVNEMLGAKPVAKPVVDAITVGDTVKVKSGATDYNGTKLASFVFKRHHTVSQIKGDRAVITYGGQVAAAVRLSDLTKVK